MRTDRKNDSIILLKFLKQKCSGNRHYQEPRKVIAKETGLSVDRIATALTHLDYEGFVTIKKDGSRGRIKPDIYSLGASPRYFEYLAFSERMAFASEAV
jgi:DNA-binding IclR family transcriptional regulator